MILTTNLPKQKLSFVQFLEQLPDKDGRYELVDGEIMRILPTRKHDNVAEFISDVLKAEIRSSNLNYRVSGRILVRTLTTDGLELGRQPDVISCPVA